MLRSLLVSLLLAGVGGVGLGQASGPKLFSRLTVAGRDPQLEKAIQVAMEELKKVQPAVPKKPRYPVHK